MFERWSMVAAMVIGVSARWCLAGIWITPLSAAGVLGKSVIFECSTTDLNDDVQWLYKSRGGLVHSLWRKPGRVSEGFFENVEVVQHVQPGGHFGFDLRLNDLGMGHEGLYSCMVGNGDKMVEKVATLSILGIGSCFASVSGNLFSHDCQMVLAGPAMYQFRWRCRLHGVSELLNRSDAITNNFGERVPVQVVHTVAKITLPNDDHVILSTCALEIVSVNRKNEVVSYFDTDLPYFNITVVMTSHVSRREPNEPRDCKVNSAGVLALDLQIWFNELYMKKHQLLEPKISAFVHTCVLRYVSQNYTTSSNRETHSREQRKTTTNCEDLNGMDCLKNYRNRVELGATFPHIPKHVRRKLCTSIKHVEACLSAIEPCVMSKRMKGLMESYRFLCVTTLELSDNSLLFELNAERCFDHYPQSIVNIFTNGSLSTHLSVEKLRNISLVNYALCQHLAGISTVHCTEHMLASYKDLFISRWYAKFMNILNQVDAFRLMAFSEVRLTDSECWKPIEPLGIHPCPFAEDCAIIYHNLLRTIHFGLVFVDNFTIFDRTVCRSTVDLKYCQKYFINNCDVPTSNIYRSLTPLKNVMCGNFKNKLKEFQPCFMSLYTSSIVPDNCFWAQTFMSHYAHVAYDPSRAMEGCQLAMDQILCIQALVTRACGLWAGRLQKELLRIIYSNTLLKVKCLFMSPMSGLFAIKHFGARSLAFFMQPALAVILPTVATVSMRL